MEATEAHFFPQELKICEWNWDPVGKIEPFVASVGCLKIACFGGIRLFSDYNSCSARDVILCISCATKEDLIGLFH